MIRKVISGGQTGADRAALDSAIKLDIPHGGWIPKGRLTEDGPLPEKYHLQEMETASYPKRTEKNVRESDGTLIFTHGELTGGSRLTLEMAEKHGKPCLHLDLNAVNAFQAAINIRSWTREHHIEVLNVAGSRASGDAMIYYEVANILEAFFHLDMMETIPARRIDGQKDAAVQDPRGYPRTLEEAVDRLTENMALKDRVTIANMTEREMERLYPRLEKYIRMNFGLLHGNRELIRSCAFETGVKNPDDRDAVEVILKTLWKTLKETHRLKLVK